MKGKIFHVISNTHWDREWRFPFEKNRQMLVDMIDETLKILETNPDYRAFHLDSQSVVLTDYLEIKPHMKDKIKRFVEQDRLLIGPWFILPEEFQVGGENLIRNLLLGHKICKEFGKVSKIGYSPFSWGQISQLPQIYSEFGIDVIMFYRGINSLDSPKAEFLWKGADGSIALASRFSTMPRYNFYFYIYRPVIHNEQIADVEYKWSWGGVTFHFADKDLKDEDFYIIKPNDGYYKENIIPSVNAIIEKQANDFTTPHVIWMEGHDSSGPNTKTTRIIADIKELMPEIDVRHSTLEEYAKLLKESADYNSLKIVEGERRSSQYDHRSGNLYGYTTSARMYLKQKNFDAERWAQFYAEPFNVLSGIFGRDINDKYLDIAWRLIVENSAHDSIGGCSLDEIHEDMMNRYKRAIEISKGVYERALKYLVLNIDSKSYPDKSIHLAVVNPTNYERTEVCEIYIDVSTELDQYSIELIDENGEKAQVEIINKEYKEPILEQMIDRPMYFKMNRYKILALIEKAKSFGLKTYYVKQIVEQNKKNAEKKLVKKIKDNFVLENDYLKVKINQNGTFDVYHKETKANYKNIGYFYDEGDAGHAWVFKKEEPVFDTLNSKPTIEILTNNSLKAEILIKNVLKIPKNIKERSSKSKKKDLSNIEIVLIARLTKTSKYLEFEVDINNTAEDHRLRMMFPTNLKAEYSYGEGQFDVVKRGIKRIDSKDWVEQPMYDYPMHHFVDLSDGKKGAAILVDGLKEYEAIDHQQRTLAITMFRAFKYVIVPSSVQDFSHKKGSQCLGWNKYRLAFYPHKGDYQEGNVYEEALKFNLPLRFVQIGKTEGTLPRNFSFFEIEPKEIIFSCFKKANNDEQGLYYIRLYNPTDKTIEGRIKFLKSPDCVFEATMEELFKKEVKYENGEIIFIAAPKKIITIGLKYF